MQIWKNRDREKGREGGGRIEEQKGRKAAQEKSEELG